MNEASWLDLAKNAFEVSTSYVDNNYRRQWEDSLNHFQSKHASDSKYLKSAYRYRSKIFRPKTRATVRANEAAASAAFFSNQDVLSIEPVNPNDPMQVAAAAMTQQIMNYRLTKTIPWYQICIGAYQDAMVTGVVCSYQYWKYREKEDKIKAQVMGDDGEVIDTESVITRRLVDEPCIELIPVENIRIHPCADWTNPVASSPYVIRLIPMLAQDVKARMEIEDPKTLQPKWKRLTDEEIRASQKGHYDSTRYARTKREDPYDTTESKPLEAYETVWVHENFIRKDDADYVFFTLGVDHILTKPRPIEDVYFTGERPFVMGCCVLETHKIYPSGVSELGKNIQQELNEIANQRMDNVKLVLNKRYFVRRGSQVDINSILTNAPGGVTLMNQPTEDVLPVDFNDVTSSSYQEQDRLNVDFDELTGNFSASTIQTNRKMNETVGGMEMLQGASNSITEYMIRLFAETWVEPVMRQLVKLEQSYETDEVVMAYAAEQAQLFPRYGVSDQIDTLLSQNLLTTVNVGMGATDPRTKVQTFMMAIQSLQGILQAPPPGLNFEEVIKEIFGRLGYKDGRRFFSQSTDPQVQQLQQQLQQMQAMLQDAQMKLQSKTEANQTRLQIQQMKEQGEMTRHGAELEARMFEKAADLQNPVVGER